MKTILVTGASSGIGRALAVQAARAGYAVYAVGRNVRALAALSGQIGEEGGTIVTDVVDISDPSNAPGLIGRAVGAFGHIDILVNNAGAAAAGPIAMQSDEQIRAQFGTHVIGPLALTREALPTLRASRGHVFMLGSGVARVPVPGMGAYPPSKAALRSATSILRRELAPLDVAVTYVDPGAVDTGFMTRAGMPGAPRDVLISPELVARKILMAIATRPRSLNVAPLQTAAVALGEVFPALAEAVLERNPNMIGAGPSIAAFDLQRDNNGGRGEKIALPSTRPLHLTADGDEPVATQAAIPEPIPIVPLDTEPEQMETLTPDVTHTPPPPPPIEEPIVTVATVIVEEPPIVTEAAPFPEAIAPPEPISHAESAAEKHHTTFADYVAAADPAPDQPSSRPIVDAASIQAAFSRAKIAEPGAAVEMPERELPPARWQYEPPEEQLDDETLAAQAEAEAAITLPMPRPAAVAPPAPPAVPEAVPGEHYDDDGYSLHEPTSHHEIEPAITGSSFDAALEPLQRRMERAKMSTDFVRSLMVLDAVIDVGDAAMRWAGMPNKHERALTSEVFFALAEWGFLAPRADGRYRVLYEADGDPAV